MNADFARCSRARFAALQDRRSVCARSLSLAALVLMSVDKTEEEKHA
jgi:hypothetical protein